MAPPISDQFLSTAIQATAKMTGSDGSELETLLLSLYRHGIARPQQTQLLTRELLDNRRLAEQARNGYLKSFLDGLERVSTIRRWEPKAG